MNAREAKKTTNDYRAQLQREWEADNRKRQVAQNKLIDAIWKSRGPALIFKIEGYIKKAAAKGYNGTYEPTKSNPNGDSVIYLEKEDEPIKERLMDYFRSDGFDVEDYQYAGLKITW